MKEGTALLTYIKGVGDIKGVGGIVWKNVYPKLVSLDEVDKLLETQITQIDPRRNGYSEKEYTK